MIRRWLPFLIWTSVLLAASSGAMSAGHSGGMLAAIAARFGLYPSREQLHLVNFTIRKLAHLLAYAAEGALALRATGIDRGGLAFALALLVAAMDEWHQSTIPSRSGSLLDVLIDSAGAAMAIGGIRAWWPRQ